MCNEHILNTSKNNEALLVLCKPTGNESVPKIIINNTINLFLKTAISVLLISNLNSFRVLFDKIASVYFIYYYYTRLTAVFRAYFTAVIHPSLDASVCQVNTINNI